MLIHTINLGSREEEVREIKPGKPLTGIAITRAELTFADFDCNNLQEYLLTTILTRMVPEVEGIAKPITDDEIRLLGKAKIFNMENLGYLSGLGTDEEKALATRILGALERKPKVRWTWD